MPITIQLLTATFQVAAAPVSAQHQYYIIKRLNDAAIIYKYIFDTQHDFVALLTDWIKETVEKSLCAIRVDVGTLCAFFSSKQTHYPFMLLQKEHMDVAVIYMLRELTTAEQSPKLHMAIRQWILATVGAPLLGVYACDCASAAHVAGTELTKDICLAVAAQSIWRHEEDEELRPWWRADGM